MIFIEHKRKVSLKILQNLSFRSELDIAHHDYTFFSQIKFIPHQSRRSLISTLISSSPTATYTH